MLLTLATLAAAGPIFLTPSDPVVLDTSGNWPRAFPLEDGGWQLLTADQQDYNYQFMDDDFVVDRESRRKITTAGNLADHTVSKCPDGSFLHAATARIVEPNDSAYSFRYDSDFQPLSEGVIAEGDTTGIYVDIPSLCGEMFQGMGYWADEEGWSTRLVSIEADSSRGEAYDLASAPVALGSSMLEDEGRVILISFNGKGENTLLVTTYDENLESLGYIEVPAFTPDGWTAYWSQGSLRVGNVYVVAHMARDDSYQWNTQDGDLFLAAFDLDWNLIDRLQLSHNEAPIGGMQPGLNIKDDRLLALYAYELSSYAYDVPIDLAAAEGWEDPTPGESPFGDPEDNDDGPPPIEFVEPCECSAGSGAAPLLPGALLWISRRRRAGSARPPSSG